MHLQDKALADAFEALVGAAFLDRGQAFCTELLRVVLARELDQATRSPSSAKGTTSRLQEWVQRNRSGEVPTYVELGAEGVDHALSWRVAVEVGGELVCACLVMAATAVGEPIVTVEGLSEGLGEGVPTDVQQAFVDTGAVQCGFCTPGLIVATHHLLDQHPEPTELQIREELSGNVCRCTGYGRIIEAVQQVAVARREVAR